MISVCGVIGNAGTLISLRIGAKDAGLISRQFGDIEPRYFSQLPNYRGFAQLMVEGHKRKAFSFTTLPPATNMGIGNDSRTIQRECSDGILGS